MDLQNPAWDLLGRLWLLDQPDSARVRVRDADGVLHEVTVPGVSGASVRQLLVSRDGTRLVALVAGTDRDRVMVARIRQDRHGVVLGATRARALWLDGTTPNRLDSLGWYSSTSVAVLSQFGDHLGQVQVTSVDGSPATSGLPGIVRFRGTGIGLLSSPAEASGLYVVTRAGLIDAQDPTAVSASTDEARLLRYAG